MINRPDYIEAIEPFIDKPLVKILAGVRRCGKSTIFEMLKEEFLRRGISEDHIISKRYTEMDIPENITAKQMYDELVEAMQGKGHCYLLLDEIQEIDGWEKAVNSLLEGADADIYVTGSNSKLMSSEISTYLTGRYISIPVYTLSFSEYLEFKKSDSRHLKELLNEYLRLGGFPIVALGSFDERSAYQIVEGIYNSVITNDITKRHNITNFDLFNRVVKYIVENVGKTFSANAIAKFLKSEGRSLSVEAVYNYLNWLEKAAPHLRKQTGTECSGAVERFAALTVTTTGTNDGWELTLGNFHDEAWLLFRANDGVPGTVTGGQLTLLTGNLYLLKAEQPTVQILRQEG